MSSPPTFAPIQTSSRKSTRPRALKDINYNSLSKNDIATSSEDEAPEIQAIAPSDAQSIVGVSLGRAQTRLNAPETPSAEKAAVLDETAHGFFGEGQIQEDAELDEEDERKDSVKSNETIPGVGEVQTDERVPRPDVQGLPPGRLPSPWRAGPKQFKKTDRWSSGTGAHTLETWRHNFMSSFPSMPSLPKHFTFNSPFSFGHSHDGETSVPSEAKRPGGFAEARKRSGSLFASPSRSQLTDDTLQVPTRPSTGQASENPIESAAARNRPPLDTHVSRQLSRTHSGLRRSASDTSLQTFRTGNSLSRVPSLGDDSRFENVQGQVNSRLKAIKDSWQDSNFNLPFVTKVPNLHSISNINLSATSPMRTNSFSKKPLPADTKQRQLSLNSPSAPSTPLPAEIKQITTNSKASSGALAGKSAASHPHFTKALHELTGDVVVLGGYRGSVLRSAEPPHRQVWVPIKVGLNIRKVDLEVGLGREADETMEEKIIPGGMLSHVGPVDISKRLFKRLRASDNAQTGRLRVHDYGYDWRLDPNYLSKRMIQFLEKLPCNQPGVPPEKRGATIIAHSLGGLITRHAVNQRPDLFAGVVYAGVPKTCVNILGPFRNGDEVLLSSRVLTAQVNFTIRTSFALLPLDGRCFFNKHTKEEYPVDFFDPQTWIDYRLSPCIARPLPPLEEPQPTGFAGIMNSMASVLPGRKGSVSVRTRQAVEHPASNAVGGLAQTPGMESSSGAQVAAEAGNIDYEGTDNDNLRSAQVDGANMSQPDPAPAGSRGNQPTSIGTTVTLPREACLEYLTRMLADVKRFKQDLQYRPAHTDANVYPPVAVIYGKTTPTVFGAKVASREAIKHADAYDELAFASGDGVVLARAAMLPEGYKVAKGGVVSSDRGHVTLLGDLEAVGKCLRAVMVARRKGVGKGHAGE